jgi:hypothetical protein
MGDRCAARLCAQNRVNECKRLFTSTIQTLLQARLSRGGLFPVCPSLGNNRQRVRNGHTTGLSSMGLNNRRHRKGSRNAGRVSAWPENLSCYLLCYTLPRAAAAFPILKISQTEVLLRFRILRDQRACSLFWLPLRASYAPPIACPGSLPTIIALPRVNFATVY